ncbi:hypothetical protein DFH08DRAFT_940627 [Mycena albidolilacea]|uniref:Uncharacterized protein n=1 Tax=Mycena albidolilacea TaxID=1033008 RepID=A0AAD6ZMG9_9AGAR|nr:hypothetical protein DFH08DRAFT_940627 [Mycena albidolilacea]
MPSYSSSVTPELSFSSAVLGRPPSTPGGLGDGSGNTSPGLAHRDVDFGLIASDEEINEGWTPVTRRMACQGQYEQGGLSELMRMAEHHHFYADKAIAVAWRKASSTSLDKSMVKPTFRGFSMSPAVPTRLSRMSPEFYGSGDHWNPMIFR